jgi:ankyrin repeat protein
MAHLAFSSELEHSPMFRSALYTLDTDILDILEFSMLHKCVLNLVQLSLAKQLMLSPEEINLPDSAGQMPLFWATTRGDAAAVKALLDYGADPNFANKHGETPLYWATEASSSACMALLLERGARPNVIATVTPKSTLPTPFDKLALDTPFKSTSSQRANKQIHDEIDERMMQEVNGCVDMDTKGFYEKYFEGKE